MISQIKLLELMSARMFHDLAGPVGAINNSIEFFEEDNPVIKEKALQIIKSSSHEAILRLKFFRQAYGTINDTEVHLNDVKPLINEFLENTKLKLEWADNDQVSVDSYISKVILNLAIIALSSMIYGGSLEVNHTHTKLKVTFVGKNLIFTEDTKALLEGDTSRVTLSSANIQIYYTHMMIKTAKASLSIKKTVDKLEFTLSY